MAAPKGNKFAEGKGRPRKGTVGWADKESPTSNGDEANSALVNR